MGKQEEKKKRRVDRDRLASDQKKKYLSSMNNESIQILADKLKAKAALEKPFFVEGASLDLNGTAADPVQLLSFLSHYEDEGQKEK